MERELGGSSQAGDGAACLEMGEDWAGLPRKRNLGGQTGILLQTAMLSRKRNRSLLKDDWVYLVFPQRL